MLLLSSFFTTLNIHTINTIHAFVVVPTPIHHRLMDSKQVEMKKQVNDVSFRDSNIKTYNFPRLYESNDDSSFEVTRESSSSSTMTTNISNTNSIQNKNMNYSPNNDKQQQNQENNDDNNDDTLNQIILHKFETYYPTTATNPPQQLLTFCLQEYKPLGLTAEESLAQNDGSTGNYHHVFVSKVIPDGNADKAGIQVGDVIVGISGLFGSTECVVGESLEKVKGMIASQRDDDDTVTSTTTDSSSTTRKGLVIKVIRGSLVMNDHESALVDLCTLPENELKVDQCIETLYKHEYDLKISTNDNNDGMSVTQPCNDAETECMLDALFSSWGEEMDLDSTENDNAKTSTQDEAQTQKPAPWSSRSSPSGTFVRDPKTGKLINIDA